MSGNYLDWRPRWLDEHNRAYAVAKAAVSARPNLIIRILARIMRPIVREAMSPWLPPEEEMRISQRTAEKIWGVAVAGMEPETPIDATTEPDGRVAA